MFPEITTRNCIYHLFPRSGFLWNIEQLAKRQHIFNGIKVIALAVNDFKKYTVEEEVASLAIEKYLPEFDRITILNNKDIGETESLFPLLNYVESTDPHTATFYAHAKGVTRGENPAVKMWTEMLHIHNLDRWEECMKLLKTHPCVGAFRSSRKHTHFPKDSKWHYSGTFYWFRNDQLFSKDWKSAIQRVKYGTEAYLSLLFKSYEGACIFGDKIYNLYSIPTATNLYKRTMLGGWLKDGHHNDGSIQPDSRVNRRENRVKNKGKSTGK